MAQIINTNVASLNAQRNLNRSQSSLQTALQRLSSGLRINSAKDDAAGLAISNRMTAQIRGMNQAVRNANDAISLAQTGEAALGEITNMLQRMRELAVQSRNATNTADDRKSLDAEFQQLKAEIDRIAKTTSFNGRKVLDGSLGSSVFQVGANVGETIAVNVSSSMRTNAIGGYAKVEYNLTDYLDGTAAEGAAYKLDVDGDLIINGVNIEAAAAATDGTGQSSAYAIARKINEKTATTGVTATAQENSLTVTAATIANGLSFTDTNDNDTLTYTLTINGRQILTQNEGDTALTAQQLVDSINGEKANTGVTATLQANGDVVLTAVDGRNIEITESLGGSTENTDQVVGYLGNTATGANTSIYDVNKSSIVLTANKNITVDEGSGQTILDGVTAGTPVTTYTANLDASDILTEANSDLAIYRIDQALTDVDTLRGTFGAIQSRFESTISALQATSENVAAARSRIRDADFAQETANLTRAQILQQAGVAMLAQANVLPQNVLALLQ